MPTVSVVNLNRDLSEIDQSERSFDIEEGAVIFDALDDQGETLPHGCLSGSCGSCRIYVLEGEENLSSASVVEKDTTDSLRQTLETVIGEVIHSANLRLSCRARLQKGKVKIGVMK